MALDESLSHLEAERWLYLQLREIIVCRNRSGGEDELWAEWEAEDL
jgi:hypothetical protein